MKNIMIDIETLGTAANSVILSIGAVAFDEISVGPGCYEVVDIDSCLRAGLVVEGRTIRWWMEQSSAARDVFTNDGIDLKEALRSLAVAFDWTDTLVWCNGANFDFPILDTAYRACGMSAPWAYNNVRDYRTVLKESPDVVARVEPSVKHHALADAIAQAQTLISMWRRASPHWQQELGVKLA